MAPDDLRAAFARAAAQDGIALEPRGFDWLCEQGHVGLERVAKARRDPALVAPVIAALEALGAIFARLQGDLSVLQAARENLLLPGGPGARAHRHRDRGRRAGALHLVPPARARDVPGRRRRRLRSPRSTWALCRALRARTDGLSRGLAAKGFGFGGVPRERAYHDALLDLATPAMGHPPVVRIAAADGDGAAAYARGRASLPGLRPPR